MCCVLHQSRWRQLDCLYRQQPLLLAHAARRKSASFFACIGCFSIAPSRAWTKRALKVSLLGGVRFLAPLRYFHLRTRSLDGVISLAGVAVHGHSLLLGVCSVPDVLYFSHLASTTSHGHYSRQLLYYSAIVLVGASDENPAPPPSLLVTYFQATSPLLHLLCPQRERETGNRTGVR